MQKSGKLSAARILIPEMKYQMSMIKPKMNPSRRLLAALCMVPFCLAAPAAAQRSFSAAEAFAYTKQAVALGPRPDGSSAILSLRTMIKGQLAKRGCEVTIDHFTAQTPDGPIPMENIIAKFPGR